MRFFYLLAALAASTIAAPHPAPLDESQSLSASLQQQQQQQHNLNKRQMRTLASSAASAKPPPSRQDASKRQAFEIGSSNYDRHISKSLAAKASGGRAAVDAIWTDYVPSSGNPFAPIYAGNGKGGLAKAKANAKGVGNGRGDAAGDSQLRAVVAMMEQIGIVS